MTLILSALGKVFGDRVISDESGERCPPLRKVVSNDILCAGFAGDFETILEAMRLVDGGETDPKVIARTGVEGLVLKDGRTYLLDCRKIWKRPKNESFYGCGTGATTAVAFLSGRMSSKPKAKLTEADIAAAFKFVAKMRTDCGKSFDFVE